MVGQLTIDYVFEGHRRGYNFTGPTAPHDDETIKSVWRHAMPRGQGWAAYTGARSIKGFALPFDQTAVAEVTVTDKEDENGRRGIRRAVVDVMTPVVYGHHLRSRLAGYPAATLAAAQAHYETVARRMPKLKKDTPFVLAYPFTTVQNWWVVEALIFKLLLTPVKRMEKWSAFTFTTLALDYREESQIVALPADRAESINAVPVLALDG